MHTRQKCVFRAGTGVKGAEMLSRITGRRILEVKPGSLELCGIEVFLLNVLPKLSGDHFTLLCMGGEKDKALRCRFEEHGIEVICKKIERGEGQYYARICNALTEELNSGSYDIVHIHGSLIGNASALCKAAKQSGLASVIVHSHNITPIRPKIKGVLAPILRRTMARNADAILACSRMAGENFFGAKEWGRRGIFVPNGINVSSFMPSRKARGSVRGDDTSSFIVGQVGRLVDQKNCLFTIDVFAELKKLVPESRLWLLGDGDLIGELKHKIQSLGIEDSVDFFGNVTDTAPYYQDMDAFLMPSKYEGLGIALIEAQASGLPCLVSDQIPDEAKLEGCRVETLSLIDKPSLWADKLATFRGFERNPEGNKAANASFSVDAAAQRIGEVYDGLIRVSLAK